MTTDINISLLKMTIVTEFLPSIGERLALVRLENGFSQSEMARHLGVSMRAYHSYEKGERGLPIEAIQHFNTAFERSADWLLFGIDADIKGAISVSEYEVMANNLDQYIASETILISAQNLIKVRGMWLQSCKNGAPAPFEIVMAWVDALKE